MANTTCCKNLRAPNTGVLMAAASVAVCVAVFASAPALADWPETCKELSASNLERAQGVMKQVYPHDCCDDTLFACMQAASPARLVWRLASAVCSRVALGEEDKAIVREMEKRSASMTGTKATIETAGLVWAGDAAAPVQVVVYACARCPFCSKSVPELYEAVTKGALKGKARLAYKAFPVKGHEYSKEGGLAFEAARAMGSLWPYLLHAYGAFDRFSLPQLSVWAKEVGLDVGRFESLMQAAETREALVESKREGMRNQVESTPTYFINGRLYKADLKTWALVGAIQEEYDRITGSLCKP